MWSLCSRLHKTKSKGASRVGFRAASRTTPPIVTVAIAVALTATLFSSELLHSQLVQTGSVWTPSITELPDVIGVRSLTKQQNLAAEEFWIVYISVVHVPKCRRGESRGRVRARCVAAGVLTRQNGMMSGY